MTYDLLKCWLIPLGIALATSIPYMLWIYLAPDQRELQHSFLKWDRWLMGGLHIITYISVMSHIYLTRDVPNKNFYIFKLTNINALIFIGIELLLFRGWGVFLAMSAFGTIASNVYASLAIGLSHLWRSRQEKQSVDKS